MLGRAIWTPCLAQALSPCHHEKSPSACGAYEVTGAYDAWSSQIVCSRPAATDPTQGERFRSEGARIEPRLDRLVLFWSDQRTPHEVLPTHTERLAISTWYHHG